MLKLEFKNYALDFKFEARTSRGILRKHPVWFLKIRDDRKPDIFGIGEAAPLERLSVERFEDLEEQLVQLQGQITSEVIPLSEESALNLAARLVPSSFPSLRFAVETALLDLVNGGKRIIFDSTFSRGEATIPINGLIWMGDFEFMKKQVAEKLEKGFTCIKLKVGALDFDRELELIRYVRSKSAKISIRLDANGGFPTNEVFARLKALQPFRIHSIEQPIMPRQPEAMSLICEKSPIPIALDEELIGVSPTKGGDLLDFIKPHYLILKPTLLGGFSATSEWITLAENRKIGWWLTSALESNIGLNAISQFAAQLRYQGYQGLGTGQLYTNNPASPLTVEGGQLRYDLNKNWELEAM